MAKFALTVRWLLLFGWMLILLPALVPPSTYMGVPSSAIYTPRSQMVSTSLGEVIVEPDGPGLIQVFGADGGLFANIKQPKSGSDNIAITTSDVLYLLSNNRLFEWNGTQWREHEERSRCWRLNESSQPNPTDCVKKATPQRHATAPGELLFDGATQANTDFISPTGRLTNGWFATYRVSDTGEVLAKYAPVWWLRQANQLVAALYFVLVFFVFRLTKPFVKR